MARSLAFELALSVGRSGWELGPATRNFSTTISMVPGTVPYLNSRLPPAERATASSGLGGDLALDWPSLRGWTRRCPKLRKTCVLSVWMRSVDDWPLAKILIQISGGKPRSVAVDQLVDVTGFVASSF